MDSNPFVSIIIPCKKIDQLTEECVEGCKKLEYENFEIIVLPDDFKEAELDKVTIVATGPVLPGVKRNIGMNMARGELCAFIDSDATPRKDWLRNAVNYLKDDRIAAVGGPGLTPDKDSFLQKAGGYILSSILTGNLSRRYNGSIKAFNSDDIHSCNLVTRKSVLKEIGGWNEQYWPGEDTLLSLAMKKKGMKMIESSDIVVYHHRRPLFLKHLRQVWSFGLHRGFFAKKFPENSLHITYLLPSLFVASLIGGLVLSFMFPFFGWFYSVILAAYLIICVFEGSKTGNIRMAFLVFSGIILTHLTYGIAFIKGLTIGNLRI